MINEKKFKSDLLQILNNLNKGWVDGDNEPGPQKKVDILNHRLSLAFEIKDDTHYKIIPDGVGRTEDLKLMNQRYSDHVNSANSKFRLYPNYRTLVLLRTENVSDIVKYTIEGLDNYHLDEDKLVYSGKVGKYTKFGKNEVGGFLIVNYKTGYFPNYLAKPERVISLEELRSFFGWKIDQL